MGSDESVTGQGSRVLEELAGGEWTRVVLLPSPRGLMATRSFHARARWSRKGGVDAYLKIIPEHGSTAGTSTRLLASPERLSRLKNRLERLLEEVYVPTPLLAVFTLKESRALVIAMAECRPVSSLIARGPSVPIGVAILERLATSQIAPWVHFDICPSNVAFLGDTPVFIDLESLYLADGEAVAVSMPAAKWNRLSRHLDEEIMQGLGNEAGLPTRSARRKHDSDTILLAMECSLGEILPELSRIAIDDAVSVSSADHAVREFAKNVLDRLLDGEVVRVDEVLAGLAKVTEPLSRDASSPIQSIELPQISVEPPQVYATLSSEAPATSSKSTPESRDVAELSPDLSTPKSSSQVWDDLAPTRRSLRLEQLGSRERREYLDVLRKNAEKFPGEFRWVDEMLLVLMAFELDPEVAINEIDKAIRRFPDEKRLVRRREVALLWVR